MSLTGESSTSSKGTPGPALPPGWRRNVKRVSKGKWRCSEQEQKGARREEVSGKRRLGGPALWVKRQIAHTYLNSINKDYYHMSAKSTHNVNVA